MNASKRLNYFRIGLVLVTSLLLWNLLPANSFSQTGGGGKAGGSTMLGISGKVVKTMNGGGYTYALVDKDGGKTWVALPMTKIAVGNEITCKPGMVMNNFRSSALNMTFKHIVFSGGVTSISGAADPSAAITAPDEVIDVPKIKIKEPENWKDF